MSVKTTFEITEEELNDVRKACRSWRTLGGIARETGLTNERTYLVLQELEPEIRMCKRHRSVTGDPLYAPYDMWWEYLNFWEKMQEICYQKTK